MEARAQRGLQLARTARINRKKSGEWTVPSESGGGRYRVEMDGDAPSCTCAPTTSSGAQGASTSSPSSTP